jgi:hypothetical protein
MTPSLRWRMSTAEGCGSHPLMVGIAFVADSGGKVGATPCKRQGRSGCMIVVTDGIRATLMALKYVVSNLLAVPRYRWPTVPWCTSCLRGIRLQRLGKCRLPAIPVQRAPDQHPCEQERALP